MLSPRLGGGGGRPRGFWVVSWVGIFDIHLGRELDMEDRHGCHLGRPRKTGNELPPF